MRFFQEAHPVSGPPNSRRWIYTTPRETGEHQTYAKTKNTKRGKAVPRVDRVL